jgi:hypothetical protein
MDVSDASYYIFIEKGNKGSQMENTKKKYFYQMLTLSKLCFPLNEVSFTKWDLPKLSKPIILFD